MGRVFCRQTHVDRKFPSFFNDNSGEILRFWSGWWFVWGSLCDVRNELQFKMNTAMQFCFLFRVPFDWRTPFGYLLLILIYEVGCFGICFSCATSISFIIGSPWLFVVIAKDITADLKHLDTNDQQQIHARLRNIIHHFSDLKELSRHFIDLRWRIATRKNKCFIFSVQIGWKV